MSTESTSDFSSHKPHQIDNPPPAHPDHQSNQEQDQHSDDQESLLDWLGPPTYLQHQKDAYQQWEKGTGTWFLEHPTVKEWMDARSDKRLLFCPGRVGAGKTTIVSLLVEHLRNSAKDQDSVVSFLYFRSYLYLEQNTSDMLSALLRQLLEGLPSIPDDFGDLRDEMKCPSELHVRRALLKAAGYYKTVFIVVDALNECELGSEDFLDAILELQSTSARIMVTFTIPDLDQLLPSFRRQKHCSSLEIRAANREVETYVNRHFGFFSFDPPSNTEDRIKQFKRVIETSDGRCADPEELLEKLYYWTFYMIDMSTHWRWATRALSWVFYAKRPLSYSELKKAFACDKEIVSKDVLANDPWPGTVQGLLDICENLLAVRLDGEILCFTHHAIYDYLDNTFAPSNWLEDGPFFIALACLECLKFLRSERFAARYLHDEAAIKDAVEQNVFLGYAACFWASHVKATETDGEMNDEVRSAAKAFLQNSSLTTCVEQIALKTPLKDDDPPITGLHLVAKYGLLIQFRDLKIELCDADYNRQDARGITPLIYAASNNHEELVNEFLESGKVNTNMRDTFGCTPLVWAARYGYTNVARALLSVGRADPNAQNNDGESTLIIATKSERVGIVQLLTQYENVVPNVKNERGMTALMLSVGCCAGMGPDARRVSAPLIRELLQFPGIDPDACNPEGITALGFAVLKNDAGAIRLLLEHGKANPNKGHLRSECGKRYSVLSYAAENGYERIVQLLLDLGNADPSGAGEDIFGLQETPIQIASAAGNVEIVRSLLATGKAKLISEGPDFTELMDAVCQNNVELVDLLLNEGHADTSIRDSDGDSGQTALDMAEKNGYDEIVQLLSAKRPRRSD